MMCCVKGCDNEDTTRRGLYFHRIPESPELKEKWLKAVPLEGNLTKKSAVCSSHFKNEDYVVISANNRKLRCLKKGVVPSIFTQVNESNSPDNEEVSTDDNLDTDNGTPELQKNASDTDNETPNILTKASETGNETPNMKKKASNLVDIRHISTENKINSVVGATPRPEGRKIMVLTPITTVNRIEDVISIEPEKQNQSNSNVNTTGISGMSPVCGLSNNSLTQSNKYIVVKPIGENERIKEFKSAENVSDNDDSDDPMILSVNESSDDGNSSDQKRTDIPVTEKIYIRETTPKKSIKRRYDQVTPMDMFRSKLPRKCKLNKRQTNTTQNTSEKPVKFHISTQTGRFTTLKEQKLKRTIKFLQQKINRSATAYNQMRTILNLIKNKCRNYEEVQQVLSLKLKQLPDNLNCGEIIIAP